MFFLFEGLFLSRSFTTPFAIGIFAELAPQINPYVAAPIGGIGALLADLAIFECARLSLHNEFDRIKATKLLHWIADYFQNHKVLHKIRLYLLWSIAGIVIASPLPDEIGVSLLSSVTEIRPKTFSLICFGFNTIGIFLILETAKALT